MKKKILTNFEYSTLYFFMTRAFLIRGTFDCILNFMHQDSWIIPIICIIPNLIYICLLDYISQYKKDLTISQKIKNLFSKKFSTFVILSITIFALALAILNLLNISTFIQSQFLTKTPIYIIAITFSFVALYVLSKGLNTITRTSVILFYISVFLFIISFLGLIPNLNINNFKPFLTSNLNKYLSSINSFFSYNIIVVFPLLSIPNNNIKNPNIKKTLCYSCCFSLFTIFIIISSAIATFGYELSLLFEYPIFHTLKYISIVGLTSRIESVLVVQLLFDIFMSLVMVTYFITDNIKNLIDIKNNNLLYILLFIISILGTIILSFNTTLLDKIMLNILPIITTIFSLTIIIIIYIKIRKESYKS